MNLISHSEDETIDAGRALAAELRPDDVVLLTGDLGAGKTAFVKGLAAGLGVDPLNVSSPTFTLIQEYRGGRLTLHHIDLYRLTAREVDDLGLEELVISGAVVAVEWPDRWTRVPAGAVRVELRAVGEDERSISIERKTT